MATSAVNVFDEIQSNSMSAVGAKYTKRDVQNVWYQLAKQIIEALEEGKGVTVKGLGTFSLSNWSLETGNNNRTLSTWRPVFTISKSLTEEFDLHQPKQYINDAVPLAPIGYHKLTKDCQLDKESVMGCIEEATQCFRKIVSEGRTVKFPLGSLGKLDVANTDVSFTFTYPCEPKSQANPKPCERFAAARAPYVKKCVVPCSGHSKIQF